MERETIITSEIPYENGLIKVTIDHLIDTIDDEDKYTGCYEATLGNGKLVKVELKNGAWIETGGGETEVSKQVGKLIENYVE